ncbi:hypothetical protein R3P38DRAFT_3170826 [Favolaschia claudopus]|uniref:Uncharacterized protein n=1 Tax=Favolaschia claudopus TaxID=2862362 RepID=A0AAW0DX98_9AGAR
MTLKGAGARKRARQGLPPVKPGKPGWVHGSKLAFFEGFVADYKTAAEIKQTGKFYERIGQRYLAKYGYNTPWEGDLDEDQDIADDVDEDEDVDSLPKEEADARAEYFKTLKSKIGVWYNTKYGGSVERKEQPVKFTTVFDKPQLAPPVPTKPRLEHYYSQRFYHERVKHRVTARWEAVSRLPNPPKEITVRNLVTKECWEAESDEFKAEVKQALEKEYEASKAAHAIAVAAEAPKKPEEYSIALNNAAYYLQPFADAVRERFGMNVAILLCGPIADRGGTIEMRSIHSGTTNGLVPRIWSDYDRGGFDAAQRSFVNFSHECFTEEECRARSLEQVSAPRAQGDDDDEGNSGEENQSPPTSGGEGASGVRSSTGSSGEGSVGATPTNAAAATPTVSDPPHPQEPPPITPQTTVITPLIDPPANPPTPHPVSQTEQPAATSTFTITPSSNPIDASDLGLGLSLTDGPFGDDMYRLDGIFEGMPQGGFNFNRLMPSDFTLGDFEKELTIGRALKAELRQLPADDYQTQLNLLREMSAEDLQGANDMARDRLFFARLQRGMTAKDALNLSSDPEDDEIVARKEKAGAQPKRTRPMASGDKDLGVEGPTPAEQAVRDEDRDPGDERRTTPERASDEGRTTPERASDEPPSSWWDIQDMGPWTSELVSAFKGFSRGRTWGGKKWEKCVMMLVEFERLNGFQDKGGLKAPCKEERPEEVADFMQRHRAWGAPFAIKTDIGGRAVEGSFSGRWWVWWGAGQPAARMEGEEWANAQDLREEDWTEMGQ